MKYILRLFGFAFILYLTNVAYANTNSTTFFKQSIHHAQEVISTGLQFIGVRYKFGGNSVDGMDCSGLVQVVFKNAIGVDLPRSAGEMSKVGTWIGSRQNLKPGDLVFFNTRSRSYSHVGIYVGDDKFLHSPRSGSRVRVEDMSKSYWVKRFDGARRIVEQPANAK